MTAPKRTRDSAATREAILDAAREVFVAEGYARASIRAIARLAGCTHGTIYIHFRDKDDLLYQLVEEQFRALLGRLRTIPRSLEPVERLRQSVGAVLDFGLEQPDHYHLMVSLRPPHAQGANRFGPMADELNGLLFDLVSRVAGNSRHGDVDTRALASALLAIVHGVVELHRADAMPVDAARQAAWCAIDLMLAGLRGGRP